VKPPKISFRRFESIDIGETKATIEDRAVFFHSRAKEVFQELYAENFAKPPEHLIHVSCTGYVSPSAAQDLVNEKKWSGTTAVSHAYHMGCYAALPAVRMAEGFMAAWSARGYRSNRVDIVHNEMCALHMNTLNSSPEQLVVQTLFADGHMKYSAKHPALVNHGFELLALREEIVPDSQSDMTWMPADGGMRMTLSRDVPIKIASVLRPFLLAMINESGLSLSEVLKTATFAVHPGGPKIIESVQEILELSEAQVQASKAILSERGNMSSATLPHIWDRLLNMHHAAPAHGHHVISLAFGPGLTVFGSIFRTIDRRI
jgi:predicted naringenin-chalcone synthase